MPRKIMATYQKARTRTIAAIGDSITSNYSWGVPEYLFWPNVLCDNLYDLGYPVKARNFATSGEKTYQMDARIACMTQFDVPDIAIIFGGFNDRNLVSISGLSQSGGTATATVSAHGLVVGTPLSLDISGASPAAYNGTFTCTPTNTTHFTYTVPAGTATPATGTIYYQFAFAQTTAYIEAMAEFLFTAGVPRVAIASRHYLNYPTGGDNSGGSPVGPAPTGTALNEWTAQHNAYTTELALHPGKVAWVDTYAHMYGLLVDNPSWVNDVTLWNIADANVHYNPVGEAHIADAVQASIAAMSGWLDAIG